MEKGGQEGREGEEGGEGKGGWGSGLLFDMWHSAKLYNPKLLSMMPKLAFMVPTSNVHVSSTGVSSSHCAMHIGFCRAALLSASCQRRATRRQ